MSIKKQNRIRRINEQATNKLRVDLIIFLDIHRHISVCVCPTDAFESFSADKQIDL
jgi:hypothetical protein